MVNSIRKGKKGELEWAHYCQDQGFSDARRGQQFHGGPDSPDVVGLPNIHPEVKRVEKLNIENAMEQSISEKAGGEIPIVAHRRNKDEWKVTMLAKDWFILYKAWLLAKDVKTDGKT